MKHQRIFFIVAVLLVACNINAQKPKAATSAAQTDVVSKAKTDQTKGEGINGLWKLNWEAYDDNRNKILDEAERKKGFRNHYIFRFNSDGSCLIQETYKGHYEVKTEGGNKMLYVYRHRLEGYEKEDPVPDVYRIISMAKNELVLLENLGDLTFWVFEKAS